MQPRTHDHAHSHGRGAPHGHDWAAMALELEAEAETFLPYVTQAIDDLAARHPTRRAASGGGPVRILDVGAGPGVFTAALAQGFPDATTVAVDGSGELLARARERAESRGLAVDTLRVDLPAGFADLPSADLIWTAQTLHHVGDQRAAVAALAGRLNSGGVLAVAEGGLGPRFLPRDIGVGRPGLQDRLDAYAAEGFAEMRQDVDGSVAEPEDWQAILRSSGLTDVRARTFLVDRPAPLDDGARRAVALMLGRYRRLGERLGTDAETLRRLVDPEDPVSVARRADVFVLAARTVYTAVAE